MTMAKVSSTATLTNPLPLGRSLGPAHPWDWGPEHRAPRRAAQWLRAFPGRAWIFTKAVTREIRDGVA